ncbi:peptidoglycan DD-metalloendopeptidase family protein [Sphingomonas swuensis]|uniref:Peptidoglycan DD-metalloendopeptidase family protein n=1 Tax=Sphingomonas swuensis TaxID=977800 RepID=A0ABP7TAS0_9SPHN
MRALALLLAAPLLLSAADPLIEAEREARAAEAEQRRLEQVESQARGAAARASAAAAAAAQAMLAADARIAASEAELASLARRQAVLDQRLAQARAPAANLLAGLVQSARRPAWVVLASHGGADEQVRLAALVRHVRPEVDRRSAALRGEVEALRAVTERQRSLVAALGEQRAAAKTAQQRFARLEQDALAASAASGRQALAAGDTVVDRADRLASLRSETEQRAAANRLAAALAQLPEAEPRPVADAGSAQAESFAWRVPASGRLLTGVGELMDNGVRSRGLTIAAGRGAQVVAPAGGTVVFSGPFRRREGVLIIDHGGGRMTLLSGLRPTRRVGERVAPGERVGSALGDLTAELFRGGTVEPAALIARSS